MRHQRTCITDMGRGKVESLRAGGAPFDIERRMANQKGVVGRPGGQGFKKCASYVVGPFLAESKKRAAQAEREGNLELSKHQRKKRKLEKRCRKEGPEGEPGKKEQNLTVKSVGTGRVRGNTGAQHKTRHGERQSKVSRMQG